MTRIKSGIVATYITFFFQIIIALFVSPYIVKGLGESAYGVYQIVQAVGSYLCILNFGIPHSYFRFSAVEKSKEKNDGLRKLNGTYFSILLFISIVVLLVGFCISLLSDNIFSKKLTGAELSLCHDSIILITVNSSFSIFSQGFDTYILSYERFALSKTINFAVSVFTSFGSLLLLFLGHSLYSILVLTILISVVKLVFLYLYCKSRLSLQLNLKEADSGTVKTLLSFSVFLFINLISDQVNWSIDRFLLGAMCGTSSTAVYGVGGQLHNMYMQLMIAISAVFVTRINDIVARKGNNEYNELNSLFVKVGRLQFMLAGLIISGFAFWGKLFIPEWVGPEYAGSFGIALILMIASTPLYIQNVGTEIQRSKGMHKFRAYTYIVMSIVNLFVSILLIRKYDSFGAAVGTAISVIIGDGVVTNIYYHKKVGLDVLNFWKNMIKIIPGMIPAIVFAVLYFRILNPVSFFGSVPFIVIYTLIYSAGIYFIGTDKEEKQIVADFLTKIRGKNE